MFLDPPTKTHEETTPSGYNLENSVLTNFAHSLLEKFSRKDGPESIKSNDNYISNKTNNNDPTTESGKKSCKGRHKHRHKKRKHKKSDNTTEMQIVPADELNKSGNISDLGSRILKGYYKPKVLCPSPRPMEASVEVEKDAKNTARSIKLNKSRRRSRTGDQIMGLGLKDKQVGNFVDKEDEDYDHNIHEINSESSD